jgi:hypothetical protein
MTVMNTMWRYTAREQHPSMCGGFSATRSNQYRSTTRRWLLLWPHFNTGFLFGKEGIGLVFIRNGCVRSVTRMHRCVAGESQEISADVIDELVVVGAGEIGPANAAGEQRVTHDDGGSLLAI